MVKNTYRVGVVGATGIAVKHPGPPPPPFKNEITMSHAAALALLPDTELVAVCDLVPELLEDFKAVWAREWPETATYTDYKEMLARERLDIIGVVTSDHRHADIVVDAATSGVKGVMCEKPLATSLEDADRMIRVCAERGVPIHVNHTRRWNPLMHKVREEVRAGLIGPLSTILAYHGGPRAMMFRNGTHIIDAVCFFAESEPAQVFARLQDGYEHWDRYKGDGGKLPENDPGATGMVLFRNGIRALYNSSKETSAVSHMIHLLGPAGEVRVAMNGLGATAITEQEGSAESVSRALHPAQYQLQALPAAYTELIGVIENGGEAVSPAAEARKTLRIMLGFLKSQQEGSRLVDVPG